MKAHFPAAQDVLSASVFDLAGVMLEVFSRQSSGQFVAARTLINDWENFYASPREPNRAKEARRALSEAWSWLATNGLVAEELTDSGPVGVFVTRAGRQVTSRTGFLAYAKAALLPRGLLRPELGIVIPLFIGGHFDAAVSTAFIQLEVSVRNACGYPDDLVGVALMRKAFHPQQGPLTDVDAVAAEKEAAMNLFAGAIGYYKNPFSHHIVGVSTAEQAASLILFTNELLARAAIHKLAADKRLGSTDDGG